MAPSPSPPGTAAHSFSSSDPGFEALPLVPVLALHQGLLARIKLCFGADRATFERDLLPLIQGYARFVHLLPATAGNYFHTPGGLLQLGLSDSFRMFEQPEKSFSWWDYRMLGFQKNRGLRIDHILVSDALKSSVSACTVDRQPRKNKQPSDHAPVVITLG